MTLLEAGVESTEIQIKCGLSVEMKSYNQDTPFIFQKVKTPNHLQEKLMIRSYSNLMSTLQTEHDITLNFEFGDVGLILKQVSDVVLSSLSTYLSLNANGSALVSALGCIPPGLRQGQVCVRA